MMICKSFTIIVLLLAFTADAFPARLDNLADKLARTAEDLAAESYNGFRDRDRGNRADVEALYLVQQFSAGASLFRRMVQDRRPVSELRDSIPILQNQIQSARRFGFGRGTWEEMDRTLDQITRELGLGRDHVEEREQFGDRVSGRMRWRGTVDDTAQIFVQGSNVSVRAIRGVQARTSTFNFTSPLPRRGVTVDLRKLNGRGTVELIQQPSRDNDFTAVIEIVDSKGGADEYELEIVW